MRSTFSMRETPSRSRAPSLIAWQTPLTGRPSTSGSTAAKAFDPGHRAGGRGPRDREGGGREMKAIVVDAEWEPRDASEIAPELAATHWAVYANEVWRNPRLTL